MKKSWGGFNESCGIIYIGGLEEESYGLIYTEEDDYEDTDVEREEDEE